MAYTAKEYLKKYQEQADKMQAEKDAEHAKILAMPFTENDQRQFNVAEEKIDDHLKSLEIGVLHLNDVSARVGAEIKEVYTKAGWKTEYFPFDKGCNLYFYPNANSYSE